MKVRALVDIPGTGIRSGEFFLASDEVAQGLVSSGDADALAKEEDVYGTDVPEAHKHPSYVEEAPVVEEQPASAKKK